VILAARDFVMLKRNRAVFGGTFESEVPFPVRCIAGPGDRAIPEIAFDNAGKCRRMLIPIKVPNRLPFVWTGRSEFGF